MAVFEGYERGEKQTEKFIKFIQHHGRGRSVRN